MEMTTTNILICGYIAVGMYFAGAIYGAVEALNWCDVKTTKDSYKGIPKPAWVAISLAAGVIWPVTIPYAIIGSRIDPIYRKSE
jgi:hypothetical protein